MRIPLVRFGSDLTPVAEWEWKWALVVVPVVLALLLVVLPICMILGYIVLLGYCLVGVVLPRRARKEWFAQVRRGFPSLEGFERGVREPRSNGVIQVPDE